MALKTLFILSAFLSFRPSNTIWISGPSGVNAAPMRSPLRAIKQALGMKPNMADLPPLQALTPSEIAGFSPFTNYAGAAYCTPEVVKRWDCSACIAANKDFELVAQHDSEDLGQFWYVGVDYQLQTVIVAHQGTSKKIKSWAAIKTDADIRRTPLVGPWKGAKKRPSTVRIHNGFLRAHESTADPINRAIKEGLTRLQQVHPDARNVAVTGHSLGGAIALLSGIWIAITSPDLNVRVITYGQPRVGDRKFSQWVNKLAGAQRISLEIERIVNRKDPISVVPPRTGGWKHTAGEIRIQTKGGGWIRCPGADNTDPRCAAGSIKLWVSAGSVKDHSGPYGDVYMRCNNKDLEMTPGPQVQEIDLDLDSDLDSPDLYPLYEFQEMNSS